MEAKILDKNEVYMYLINDNLIFVKIADKALDCEDMHFPAVLPPPPPPTGKIYVHNVLTDVNLCIIKSNMRILISNT